MLRSDWASAVSSTVMTRAGRCYRSRFGGAILLTRSLLRQAASSAVRRCVISSKARSCQTVCDLQITSFFLLLLNMTLKESWSASAEKIQQHKKRLSGWDFFFYFFVCELTLLMDSGFFFCRYFSLNVFH